MNENNKLLLALLTGVAIGAALGMLITPEKGPDMRKKIANVSEEAIDKAYELKSKIRGGMYTGSHNRKLTAEEVGDYIN